MRFIVMLAGCLLLLGCGDVMDLGETQARLIPPGDPDHTALETPEQPDECSDDMDCLHSCVHGCRTQPTGPITCPAQPDPLPQRLAGAECVCADSMCAWWPAAVE